MNVKVNDVSFILYFLLLLTNVFSFILFASRNANSTKIENFLNLSRHNIQTLKVATKIESQFIFILANTWHNCKKFPTETFYWWSPTFSVLTIWRTHDCVWLWLCIHLQSRWRNKEYSAAVLVICLFMPEHILSEQREIINYHSFSFYTFFHPTNDTSSLISEIKLYLVSSFGLNVLSLNNSSSIQLYLFQ